MEMESQSIAISANDELGFGSNEALGASRERLKMRLNLYEANRATELAENKLRSKADRLKGRLNSGLTERLSACNIVQLRTAKNFCNALITRQTNPPREQDCPNRFCVKVLTAAAFKNRLYRVELRRTTQRADKVYVNGPYVYAYRWDGAYVRSEYFGSKDLRNKLPRRVWQTFKTQLAGMDIEKLKSEGFARASVIDR